MAGDQGVETPAGLYENRNEIKLPKPDAGQEGPSGALQAAIGRVRKALRLGQNLEASPLRQSGSRTEPQKVDEARGRQPGGSDEDVEARYHEA